MPIKFDLTERPLHAVDLNVAYSTDLGVNFSTAWHNRNLFGNAEQLNLTAAVQLGGDAVTQPGYQVGAQFIKPDFLARDQSLEVDLNAVKQSLQAYDQTALQEKIALNRKLAPHWTASLGLSAEQESIVQEGETRHYNLIAIPASLRFDNTTSLLNPTSGVRATLSVTPTKSLGATNSTFLIMQLAGSTYLDLLNNGRTVIALRGLVGQASGVDVFGLPPDQRFYAGGSATVRGYRYQTLGAAISRSDATGWHGDLDRNHRAPAANPRQLWLCHLPGHGTGQFDGDPVYRWLACRSRGWCPLLHRQSGRSDLMSRCL